MSNTVTQEKVNLYVEGAKTYPLVEGQLVSMVILHFDIPDQLARQMVRIALHKHHWMASDLFFVGQLYSRIYPWYCECRALRKQDGTILEPKVNKEDPL